MMRARNWIRCYSMSKPLIFAPETYQYEKGSLHESQILQSPIAQFHQWFEEAKSLVTQGDSLIPEATTFSTARLPSGRVSSRIVLLKELDERGYVVFSNWDNSKKSHDIRSNAYASLTFFWPHLQRQVRVEGLVEKISRDESVTYFNTRPRGSKIGAWASPQSQTLSAREDLEKLNKQYEDKFAELKDDEIPCPDYWGGVRIVPLEVEFWQGRPSRLHDRLTFRRESEADPWTISRLGP